MSRSEELGKTALRIYLHLLESEVPLGVREIARALDMPVSTVHYHIRRLEELGIVKQKNGGYVVSRPIRIEGFIHIGKKLVPRLLIYSFFYMGVSFSQLYLIISRGIQSPDSLLTLVVSLSSMVIFIIEGLVAKRRLES